MLILFSNIKNDRIPTCDLFIELWGLLKEYSIIFYTFLLVYQSASNWFKHIYILSVLSLVHLKIYPVYGLIRIRISSLDFLKHHHSLLKSIHIFIILLIKLKKCIPHKLLSLFRVYKCCYNTQWSGPVQNLLDLMIKYKRWIRNFLGCWLLVVFNLNLGEKRNKVHQ